MQHARSMAAVSLCVAGVHLLAFHSSAVCAQSTTTTLRRDEIESALVSALHELWQRWQDPDDPIANEPVDTPPSDPATDPEPDAQGTCNQPSDPLLPDMVVNPQNLRDHRLSTSCDGLPGVELCLRISVGTINVGLGDLLLTAPVGQQDHITEHISTCGGGEVTAPVASAFIDEPSHQHLHLRDWTEMRLRRIDPSCDQDETALNCPVAGVGHKVSFCLTDSERYDLVLGRGRGQLYCGVDQGGARIVQGISSGWMDVYNRTLPGQLIDVTQLDSGDYWLEVEVNPGHSVVEASYDNNLTRTRIELLKPHCGDGALSVGEACDASAPDALPACRSLGQGFGAGQASCDETCQLDTSACARVACPQHVLGSALGPAVATGANPSGPNVFTGEQCDFTAAQTGSETTFGWTAPSTGTFVFDTQGSSYDTVAYLLGPACEPLPNIRNTCNDDIDTDTNRASSVTLRMVQGERVVIVVDAYDPEVTGQFVLNVSEHAEPVETRAPLLPTVQ